MGEQNALDTKYLQFGAATRRKRRKDLNRKCCCNTEDRSQPHQTFRSHRATPRHIILLPLWIRHVSQNLYAMDLVVECESRRNLLSAPKWNDLRKVRNHLQRLTVTDCRNGTLMLAVSDENRVKRFPQTSTPSCRSVVIAAARISSMTHAINEHFTMGLFN